MAMDDFVHRDNKDGSYDSICRKCVRTIGTSHNEMLLAVDEKLHVCDPLEPLMQSLARLSRVPEMLRENPEA